MTEKKQLALVVEGTTALGPYWRTIVSGYLEKVIRKFCCNDAAEAASSVAELALVQFNAHGSNSMCLVQRSGWVRNVDYFLECPSCMHFSGGGFCDAAVAEGLAEVLMMCRPPNGTETQLTEVVQRHCILVATSDPYPLPTVYWPPIKSEMQSVSCSLDAETIAKLFSQTCVSLSVIGPKQLPKLKAIYNAGKRNPSATAPTIDVGKNPNYLILISEDFMEAYAALSPSIISSPSNQSPSYMQPPSTSVSPVNKLLLTRQPVSRGNILLATVKVEPSTVSPTGESSPGASGSAPLSGTAQVARHSGTMMAAPGMPQQVQEMQSVGVNNNMGTNVGLSQQTLSAQQSGQAKYVKIWEAYRSSSSAGSLAEDWPSTFLIDRLISLDNSKQYAGKCEFVVFRALQQHGFLGQMLEKKLCAVIKLPSQSLLLTPCDKPTRLIGMLLPQVVFKPPISGQQLSQQQQRTGPGTSQDTGNPTQLVGVGQGQVSSPGLKPKQELP